MLCIYTPLDKKTAASWKLVRARLDILHRLLNSGTGVVMSNPTTKPVAGKKPVQHSNKDVTSAIPTVKAIMEFTEPYLHHMNVEVREAAGHVVVDVMQATGGEDAVAPFLKKLRPQQLSSVRALFAAANGAPLAAAAAKGRAPGPWVQKPTKTVGASAEAGSAPLPGKAKVQSSEDAAEVALLQTERDDLKVQVDAQQRKTIAESNAKHHLGEQSDASSPSPTKGFWKGKVRQKIRASGSIRWLTQPTYRSRLHHPL
ncbi:hypothetical protein HKX48_004094 [Thoreauomyces humboldtii]|nr:hypothetical protein HKX48_004094 [Thoreauomyces humboldtii]